MNKYQIGLAAVVLASFVSNANAASTTNVAAGSVAVVGPAGSQYGQVFNNLLLDGNANRSNYMVFDLTSLASQLGGAKIGSATLTITMPGSYGSSDASESFSLWDFSGNVNALKNYSYGNPPNLATAAAVRDDLRSGTSYGSTVISQGPLSQITITLNQAAILALDSVIASPSKLFAIGGWSSTLSPEIGQYLFTGSGGAGAARLDVNPVPLPGAVWLFGSGVALYAAARRRKKAAAAVAA